MNFLSNYFYPASYRFAMRHLLFIFHIVLFWTFATCGEKTDEVNITTEKRETDQNTDANTLKNENNINHIKDKDTYLAESLRFATVKLPPIYHPKGNRAKKLPYLRLALASLPEAEVVKQIILSEDSELHLNRSQTKQIFNSVTILYRQIKDDKSFAILPSALPLCYGKKRMTEGHYFLLRPVNLPDNPRAIVFLHGDGGNFLYYARIMSRQFPHAIILLPTWSQSWKDGKARYISDALKHTEKYLDKKLGKPWVVALSAAGRSAFVIYNENYTKYSGLIGIATLPNGKDAKAVSSAAKILLVNGKFDRRFKAAAVEKKSAEIKKRASKFELKMLDSDHFFFLTATTECFKPVHAFIKKHEKEGTTAKTSLENKTPHKNVQIKQNGK